MPSAFTSQCNFTEALAAQRKIKWFHFQRDSERRLSPPAQTPNLSSKQSFSERELDQNSTERYCVMCSSLFGTVQQQSSQIDTPPSHAAERAHGAVGLISTS